MIIIADTSCLITLERSDALSVLHKVFGEIAITPEIRNEFQKPLPDWVKEIPVKNKEYQILLERTLDKGEASAIALVQELENAFLIIDEVKGRKVAQKLGIKFTGTLGVLLEAKKLGYITSLQKMISKLKANGFRISEIVEAQVLRKANEL
ncbi:DUF3368 domain-containing protein [Marinoscillum sp.]|uniref:DUF3368 domain-containing protein n=1 Tax=Marinoscillum sp. TaxID=2024838 RepID=UPI003BAA0F05